MKTTRKSLLTTLIKTTALAMLFLLFNYAANAQALHRVFTFNTGDVFEKQIVLNSTCIIQRGDQKIDISSSSSVSKAYRVTGASEKSYDFTITIQKMDNVVHSLGHELHYNSENAIDTTSAIHRALKYMVGKPVRVSIDKNGTILSADDVTSMLANDTLLTFAGLPEDPFIKGRQFGLVADFSASKNLKKGYSWTDSLAVQKQKTITQYVIEDITDEITIVKFKSAVTGDYLNSNTNGTYVLDNRSGIIIQKLVESISTGYQVQNKVLYATTRRTNLSENCVKKN